MNINEPIATLYHYILSYRWQVIKTERNDNTISIHISGALDYPDVEYLSPVTIEITLDAALTTFAII